MTSTRAVTVAFLGGTVVVAALILGFGRGWVGREARAEAPPVTPAAQRRAPEPARAQDPWRIPGDVVQPALVYDRFETIDSRDGLPSDKVTTVLVEGTQMCVGTDRGLAIRQGDTWRILGAEDGLAHPYVTSLARDETTGDLWISTLRGLSRLSGGKLESFTQTSSGLANDVVYHVLVSGGLVWAATAAGTSCLDTSTMTWALYDHESSIMHEPWCYALADGPGRLWIGVWGGGVVELDAVTDQWREYRDPDGEMELDLLVDDGPIHDVTAFLAYDQGVLWQATYFGLSRYDGRRWHSYVAADTGLPGDFINHVDAMGHTAWIGSDQGLGVFDGERCVSYVREEDGRCRVTTWEGGREVERRTIETAPPSNYVLWVSGDESEVWFATGAGLCHGVSLHR